MYVFVGVCMYVCLNVRVCAWGGGECVFVYACGGVSLCVGLCLCVCDIERKYVCLCVRLCVSMCMCVRV